MKIKIIDLLNKIANGEEDNLLTEFEFDNRVWNFKRLNDNEFCLDGWLLNQNITITKHKEILEEPKKIEKLNIQLSLNDENTVNHYRANNLECDLTFKINELIDVVNELKRNK